jgi:hypothetical protein
MKGAGGTVFGEKRFKSMAAVGVQARVHVNNEQRLSQGGAIGKVWLEGAKLLLMGEADLLNHAVVGSGGYNGFVGLLSATLIPTKGVMVGVAGERYQEDLRASRTGRNAVDLQVNLFPWAHIELLLFGRYQVTGGGSADGNGASLIMAQLHYYL